MTDYYYDLFAKAKTEHYSFEQIITELYRITGNVEASFSSKMLATIDASKPIWDQYVLQNLGFELMGKTQEEKLQNAVTLYDQIVNWYADYLTTNEARENIEEFDRLFQEYAWVSDTKKNDCLLRRWRHVRMGQGIQEVTGLWVQTTLEMSLL